MEEKNSMTAERSLEIIRESVFLISTLLYAII